MENKAKEQKSLEELICEGWANFQLFLFKWIGAGYIKTLEQQIIDDIVIALTTVPSLSVDQMQQRADALLAVMLGAIPNTLEREAAQFIIPPLINKWIASGDAWIIAKAQAQTQGLTLAAGN